MRMIDQELTRCLRRRDVAFTTQAVDGMPITEVDWDDARASDVYDACYSRAEEVVYPRLWSDPALLYLGYRDPEGLTLLRASGGRTLLAAGSVALLAVAVTVMVSRRLLRPVAALTTAAQRMGEGQLAQRVEVKGDDELAGLARSFNAMADAVATNEQQRRRLVNDVAHELRTPLANVRGYLEAVLDGLTPADRDLIASLHEEAVLLQRLVDDLQTLALAEARRLVLHREALDLAAIADQVAAGHSHQAETAGIELVVQRHDAAPLTVEADAGRLRQALGNLVSNALRYSAAGDRVTVRVLADEDDAVAEVADTGTGIAPDDLPHVFDRFWRADTSRTRETGGSGLGLAICSQLIEAHGGTVDATSTLGAGSTFTVRLPRLAASGTPDR
jgi:two-component system, OmpR family, sensor histidine kinase BaeS